MILVAAVRLEAEITVGMTESALIEEKGKPASRIGIGGRDILRWPDLEATVTRGSVTKLKQIDPTAEAADNARREKLAAEARAAAEGKELYAKSFLGKVAPELIVSKWITQPPPSMKGKFVLVDFWTTWCGPCLRSIPELNRIRRKFSDDLVVIGLSDETPAAIQAMLPRIDYYVATDPPGNTKNAVEVRAIPHCLLIDPQGIVRWEGNPLQPGYELTLDVVAKIVADYR